MRGEDRVVRADDEFGPFRQGRLNLFQQGTDAVRNRQVIGLGLPGDGQADLVQAIAAEQAAVLFGALLDPGDVAPVAPLETPVAFWPVDAASGADPRVPMGNWRKSSARA